jgi:REP element-mobilizing transposase RayT
MFTFGLIGILTIMSLNLPATLKVRLAASSEFADAVKKAYSKSVFWSGSYYVASCGGAPIEVIRKYIQSQDTPQT